MVEPGVECRDGIGVRALTVGDGDEVSEGFLVGLGPVDREQQPGRLALDVGQSEADEFGDRGAVPTRRRRPRRTALMHRIVPVHTTLMARTSRAFDLADVSRAWATVCGLNPALRARIVDDDLELLKRSKAEVRVYETVHAALADNEADPVDP